MRSQALCRRFIKDLLSDRVSWKTTTGHIGWMLHTSILTILRRLPNLMRWLPNEDGGLLDWTTCLRLLAVEDHLQEALHRWGRVTRTMVQSSYGYRTCAPTA